MSRHITGTATLRQALVAVLIATGENPDYLTPTDHLTPTDLMGADEFRLGEPKPKVSDACVLIALDAAPSVSVITPGRGCATSLTRHTSFGIRRTRFP